MGYVTRETKLPAKAEKVWKYITDPVRFPEWIDGYIEGNVTTPHGTGLGARYEWYGKMGPLKLRSTEEIVEWQDGKRVAYKGQLSGIKFRSFMEVNAVGRSETQIEIGIKYDFPVLLGGRLTDVLFFERFFQQYGTRSLEKLKALFDDKRVEDGRATPSGSHRTSSESSPSPDTQTDS